jgi:hypothetical protein
MRDAVIFPDDGMQGVARARRAPIELQSKSWCIDAWCIEALSLRKPAPALASITGGLRPLPE